jgi:hypothetical protein
MDISYVSIIIFILTTLLYFSSFPVFGKPALELDANGELTDDNLITYYSNCRPKLAIYLLVIIVTQFILNITYLINKCGGDAGKNISAAAYYTFFPWLLIFGIMLAMLSAFPKLKSVFSDVVGYYFVSFESNEILSSILIDTNMKNTIDGTTDPIQKGAMMEAAEAILKICGNKSLLINQIYPENFSKIWLLLKPLMNPGMFENIDIKKQLLALVVSKDNTGESMWYIYTAILVTSIVYYNLATRGCIRDAKSIKASYDKYLESEIAKTNQENLGKPSSTQIDK